MAGGHRRARSHSRQQGVPYQQLLLIAGAFEWRCGLKKGVIVWGAGEPGEVETGAVEPVGLTGSFPCTELREGVGWATDVVAAGASAESSLAAVGTAKTEAKS